MTKLKFRMCKNNTNLAGATTHMRNSVRGKKIMLTRKKIFLAHLWHFKVISFEDSTFIHSCSKLDGDICYFPFANINFKTHATNLTYLLGHSVVSWNSRQRSSEARANIGTCVFSHNPYVCTRISEKRNALGL